MNRTATCHSLPITPQLVSGSLVGECASGPGRDPSGGPVGMVDGEAQAERFSRRQQWGFIESRDQARNEWEKELHDRV